MFLSHFTLAVVIDTLYLNLHLSNISVAVFRSANAGDHSVTKVSANRAQNASLLLKKGIDSPEDEEMLRNDIIKCIIYRYMSVVRKVWTQ
jgi:hypothetical protein